MFGRCVFKNWGMLSVAATGLSTISANNSSAIFRVHEAILLIEIILVGGGIHEAECRIDGCMIHALVLTEIYLAQIHGGYAESAADRDEKCRCQQKECKRDILTSIKEFSGLFSRIRTQ